MKTKISLLSLLCILCTFSLTAQTITQDRQVGTFSSLAASCGIDVIYTEGNTCSVRLEAESAVIDKIETTVKDGTLVIKKKDNELFETRNKMVAHITAPTLIAISMSGGADFATENLSNPANIKINSSGGADIKINKIKADDIQINLSGGADANIKLLKANALKLNTSGGCDADITVDVVSLNANASGGSDINLSGNTRTLTIKCSGGSDGNIKNLKYDTINTQKSGGGSINK